VLASSATRLPGTAKEAEENARAAASFALAPEGPVEAKDVPAGAFKTTMLGGVLAPLEVW
jgi:hypothetical protein